MVSQRISLSEGPPSIMWDRYEVDCEFGTKTLLWLLKKLISVDNNYSLVSMCMHQFLEK